MASPLNLSKPDRPIRCGVLLLGGETELLDVAPIDMLHGLGKHFVTQFPDDGLPPGLKEQALDLEFFWVSEQGPSVNKDLTSGCFVKPTHSFADCPALDVVLIGASDIHLKPMSDAEIKFVQKAYDDSCAFITVCGGVEAPRMAGILEGKTATGPRFVMDGYRKDSPGTNWVEKRWVRDGKLWTSGALVNGLDLMYNFCEEYWGGENSLCSFMAQLGHWPNREVDYKDVSFKM